MSMTAKYHAERWAEGKTAAEITARIEELAALLTTITPRS